MITKKSRYEKPEKKPACRNEPLRSQKTGSEQQRIARQKKTEEKPRLGKNNDKNTDKTDSFNNENWVGEKMEKGHGDILYVTDIVRRIIWLSYPEECRVLVREVKKRLLKEMWMV